MNTKQHSMSRREFVAAGAIAATFAGVARAAPARPLRAGGCAIDISPEKLPVIVSGSFYSHTASKVRDPLHVLPGQGHDVLRYSMRTTTILSSGCGNEKSLKEPFAMFVDALCCRVILRQSRRIF